MTPAAQRNPSRTGRALAGSRATNAFAFVFGLALVLLYALRGGGSYDLVTRQEYGLVIWWLLAVGLALGLFPRARSSRSTFLLLGALLAYGSWTALSLVWTDSSERTFAELARVLDYLGLVALIVSVLDRHTWRAAAAGLGFGALVVCGLALASRLAPSAFPIDSAARSFRTDRLDYPFGYWNAVGTWGATSSALALAWSVHDTSRARRAVALGLVPVVGVVTYLTYSRAAVAAIVLAVLLVLSLSRNRLTAIIHTLTAAAATGLAVLAVRHAPEIANAKGTAGAVSVLLTLLFSVVVCGAVAILTAARRTDKWRAPARLARAVGMIAVVAVVIAGAAYGPHLASRAWDSFRNTAVTNAAATGTSRLTNLSGTRYNLWKEAVDAFRAHPATGTGAGTYQFWWENHQLDTESVRNAHSLWLENLAELGLPGLLLILGVAVSAAVVGIGAYRKARRSASAGACTALLCGFLVYLLSASVDWMWQSTAVTIVALGGIAIMAARLSGSRRPLHWVWRIGLVAFAVLAGLIQIPGLLATAEVGRSQAAERAGHPAQALAWASDAVAAEPWAASPYEQRALVLEGVGRLASALADERRAIAHEPDNFVHWLILARIQTERGRYRAALAAYRQSRRLGKLAVVFQTLQAAGGN